MSYKNTMKKIYKDCLCTELQLLVFVSFLSILLLLSISKQSFKLQYTYYLIHLHMLEHLSKAGKLAGTDTSFLYCRYAVSQLKFHNFIMPISRNFFVYQSNASPSLPRRSRNNGVTTMSSSHCEAGNKMHLLLHLANKNKRLLVKLLMQLFQKNTLSPRGTKKTYFNSWLFSFNFYFESSKKSNAAINDAKLYLSTSKEKSVVILQS